MDEWVSVVKEDAGERRFLVVGPLGVPYYQGKGGRTITDDNVKALWRTHSE